ncbi:AAA family ATPase [Halorubraceae archaeon YAN]|nr:AAA family ATPase [Halorubraceae archaeon YAN]
MDDPLWTDAYAPSLSELPQADLRDRLDRTVDEPMNLIVQGPKGVGKTAAVRALAEETHENTEADLVEINVADFFGRTKKEIRNDPRFEQFLTGRSRMAKRDMINRVLKESASYAPVSGTFKTIVLDNAEAIREDFQQALRRVMEQHHRTTQFVFTTRQPSKLIAPIQSRCFPVPVRSPTVDEIIGVLEPICVAEEIAYDTDGLEFIASAAGGNLREAILTAQTTAMAADEITMQSAYETLGDLGDDETILSILTDARTGDLKNARKTIDTLLTDEGYDGQDLLSELLRVARSKGNFDMEETMRLHKLAGEADLDLVTGLDEKLHLVHLLGAWAVGRSALRESEMHLQ